MSTKDERIGDQRRSIAIPDRLVSRVEDRLPHAEFDTVDDWITYALEEVLIRIEETPDDTPAVVQESEIERRLESLGYLDG